MAPSSSIRTEPEKLIKALKFGLRKQQEQIDTLLDQRSFLEDKYRYLYDRWLFDSNLSHGKISRMRRKLQFAELAKEFAAKKVGLIAGAKERDACLSKIKLDYARSELSDFKAWFEMLSHRCPDQEDIAPETVNEFLKAKNAGNGSSDEPTRNCNCNTLENEVATLKREFKNLSVKNISAADALQAELNFAWNQFREMESNLNGQIQAKNNQIDQAKEKIVKLLESVEQLQSSNAEKSEKLDASEAKISKLEAKVIEKDGEISKLLGKLEILDSHSSSRKPRGEPSSSRLNKKTGKSGRSRTSEHMPEDTSAADAVANLTAKITELEAEGTQKDEKISALSKELELLRSRKLTETPIMRPCASQPSNSRSKDTGKDPSTRTNSAKGGSTAQQGREQGVGSAKSNPRSGDHGSKGSRRKRDGDISKDETPKLFTSHFKIPKLKSQSPRGKQN